MAYRGILNMEWCNWCCKYPPGPTQVAAAAVNAGAASHQAGYRFLQLGSLASLLNAQASLEKVNCDFCAVVNGLLNNQKARINVGQQVPISTALIDSSCWRCNSANLRSSAVQFNIKIPAIYPDVRTRVNASAWVIMKLSKLSSNVVPVSATGGSTTQQPLLPW